MDIYVKQKGEVINLSERREYLSSYEEIIEFRKYWKDKLKSDLRGATIPQDFLNDKLELEIARYVTKLPNDITKRLMEVSKQSSHGLYIVLLSSIKYILHSYLGDDDILVGMPEFLQNKDLANEILPIRTHVKESMSFTELLNDVKTNIIEADRNSYYNIYEILNEKEDFDNNISKLINMTVALDNIHIKVNHDKWLNDISVNFKLVEDNYIECHIVYNSAMYNSETIDSFVNNFIEFTKEALKNPQNKLEDICFLTKEEKNKILYDFNRTRIDYLNNITLSQVFENQVKKTPNNIAVIVNDEKITYSKLNQRANQLARILIRDGINKGDIVPISIERSFDMMIGIMAILKAGAAYLPVDIKWPIDRVKYILKDCKAKYLVVNDNNTFDIKEILNISNLDLDSENDCNLDLNYEASDIAYVIYTSGSTGNPKGTMVKNYSVINRLNWMQRMYQLNEEDVILQKTPFTFDVSVWELFWWISAGAKVSMLPQGEEKDPNSIIETIYRDNVTTIHFVPSMLKVFLEYVEMDNDSNVKKQLKSLKRVFSSGEALNIECVNSFRQILNVDKNKQLINLYGPTEATVDVSYYDCNSEENRRVIPIGKPIDNIKLIIMRDDKIQPIGVQGELCIAGDGLAEGYLNNKKLTEEKFVFSNTLNERIYKTGDLARWLSDGNIEYLGRTDSQVKIRGFRVELEEIEACLNKNFFIKDSAVILYDNGNKENNLVACVALNDQHELNQLNNVEKEQVNEWNEVFEDTYTLGGESVDSTFNTVGWQSSYTGEPIDEEEMKEWLDNTVDNIMNLNPKGVLEIGCGTGMILFKVAPYSKAYYGIDISSEAINYIEKILKNNEYEYRDKVCLFNSAADNLDVINSNELNLVILNSVIQYFPNTNYLIDVIRDIICRMKKSGTIYIGDVRNNSLIAEFYTSVVLHSASPKSDINSIKEDVKRKINQENELLISPEFFIKLKEEISEIKNVDIKYKKSKYNNELSIFRYDVVLHVGDKKQLEIEKSINFKEVKGGIDYIKSQIIDQNYNLIKISEVPNLRLEKHVRNYGLLKDNNRIRTVDELMIESSKKENVKDGITVEMIKELGNELGYGFELIWKGYKNKDSFDVIFIKKTIDANEKFISYYDDEQYIAYKNVTELSNNPMISKISWEKLSYIKGYLEGFLPDYMIPSSIIQVDEIPLLDNGKRDNQKLIKMINTIDYCDDIEMPRGDIETQLVDIWKNILNVKNVGVTKSFFNLGGDSIKAITLINRINKIYKTNLKIKDIYRYQTVRECADLIHNDKKIDISSDLESGLEQIEKFKMDVLNSDITKDLKAENIEDFYPISQIQKGMIFYSKLRPEEPIYLDQFIYQLKFERFNKNTFETALKVLINKHGILRTGFNLMDYSQPVQILYKSFNPDVRINDIATLQNKEEHLKEYLKEDLNNRFVFENELLWRIKIFKLDDVNYCLVLSFHHAILDGWSVATFVSEFIKVYNNMLLNNDYNIERLKHSYKDYVAIGLGRKVSDDTKKFWINTLKGYSKNKLPFNFTGKKISDNNNGKLILQDVDKKLFKKLEGQAVKNGWTIKEMCIAAYVYLLHITTNESDIVTGIVSHDRPEIDEAEKIVGCFLNTIPMRVNLDGEITKYNLINSVQKYLRNVKEHELFLSDISEVIGEPSNMGNPIFDTILNYVDFYILDETKKYDVVSESKLELVLDPNEMTNTMLDFEVSKTFNRLSIRIKYSQSYFYHEEMEYALKLYLRILECFSENRDYKLSSEQFIIQEEKDYLVNTFNDTYFEFDDKKNLHELFEEQAELRPESIAIALEKEKLTYEELNKRANRLARKLRDSRVHIGDNVAIVADRNFNMIIGMMAILKVGGAYIPIDPEYPIYRKRYIIENSNASCVLIEKEDINLNIKNQIILDNDTELCEYSDENLNLQIDNQQLAYIIYTSGSTGNPKGVMIEHKSIVNLIQWVNYQYDVTEKDSILFITSMCFDLSVYDIFGMLAAGGRIVISQKSDVKNPEKLKKILKEEKITFWDSVPTTLNYLINNIEDNNEDYVQNNLRIVFMSGDWIPVKLPEKIIKHFPNSRPISLGGATEGTVWSIHYPISKVGNYKNSIPYGKPIGNNKFYLLDKDKNLVPKGVAGELYIGGIGVARGYSNDKEKTDKAFFRDIYSQNMEEFMYKTGDYGKMIPNGNIEFLGRVDYQVKIRGFRVELGEIENVLMTNSSIKDAVVINKNDKNNNNYLCAYLVFDYKDLTINDIKEYLSDKLPDYMIPSYFIRLDEMPVNTNGKVDRKRLIELEVDICRENEYIEPSNETEEKLAKIWREVLEVEQIGIDDNFFDIGGNSILLLQILGKVNKVFDGKVKATDLFVYTTIRELSEYIISYDSTEQLNLKIKANILPQEYFSRLYDENESSTFEFQIDRTDFEALKVISKKEDIKLDNILLAINLLTYKEISYENEVVIQSSIETEDHVKQIIISFEGIEEYSQLFSLVNSLDKKSEFYKMESISKLVLDKNENEVVALFLNKKIYSNNLNYLDVYDLIFEYEIGQDSIIFKVKYNSSRLNEISIQEFISGYIQLLEYLIEQYN